MTLVDGGEIIRRCCLFVSSSDNTVDVFRQVVPASMARYWPDCDLECYVGLNESFGGLDAIELYGRRFRIARSPVKGWGEELKTQIAALPGHYDYVLMWLDDFLLRAPVDTSRLHRTIAAAIDDAVDYLRLVPVERSLFGQFMLAMETEGPFRRLSEREPYHSSLQVALWRRSHLEAMLDELVGREGDIWSFEQMRVPGASCHAVRSRHFDYLHVVEKGRWQPYASALMCQHAMGLEPGERLVAGRWAWIGLLVGRLKFKVLGYSVMRLKAWLGGGAG